MSHSRLTLLLALASIPAQAQGIEAVDGLATSLNEKALAVFAALLLLAVIFLFRQLLKSQEARDALQEARLEDLRKSNEAAMAVQDTSIRLSIQSMEMTEVFAKSLESKEQ